MTKAYKVPLSTVSTNASAVTRWVGGTASGAPSAGTWAIGDLVVSQNGKIWICTVAGTPGTWVDVSGSGGTAANVVTSYGATANKLTSAVNASPPGSPVSGDLWMVTDVTPISAFSVGELMALGL